MRTEKADRHEERILGLFGKLFDCPFGRVIIQLIRILGRPDSPVHKPVILRGVHELFLGESIWQFRPGTRFVKFSLGQSSMIDLPQGRSGVAVQIESLGDRHVVGVFGNRFEGRLKGVDPRGGWPQPEHNGGTGGVAYGGLAMGIGKQSSASRQFVQVRGLYLRMSAQATDPVVEVVDGKEQDVWFCLLGGGVCRECGKERKKSEGEEGSVHDERVWLAL